MNLNALLADPEAIEIEEVITTDKSITIVVQTIRPEATCPVCQQGSRSVKAHYVRRPDDLPWHGVAVRLELRARKFRCRNEQCQRKVFCERLPRVAAVFARRTLRLAEAIRVLAFALGGRPLARVSQKLAMTIGKDACLRLMRRAGVTVTSDPPRVVGVDDFAFRRGATYGTIVVDLERRRTIDLLPDREARTLERWLRDHSRVEIVSRDRSPVYAEAARQALPEVVQVADRWHLIVNLSEFVERFLAQHQHWLTEAAEAIRAEHPTRTEVVTQPVIEETDIVISPHAPALRRQALFDQVKQLQSEGKGLREISRELKVSRNTVRRYARSVSVPPPGKSGGRPSKVRRFADYLWRRWQEGEHNCVRLYAEIKERGFSGDISGLWRFVQAWRPSTEVVKTYCPLGASTHTPQRLTRLLLNPAAERGEGEQLLLDLLLQTQPAIRAIKKLGRAFQQLIRSRNEASFDEWLVAVSQSGITELQQWTKSLLTDEVAVRNALRLEWSNGPVEGQVNRLKNIKRQMFGRANFDLLRARVLYQS